MTTTAHLPAASGQRHVPGEAGTWVFIFGDLLVFGAFFVTFLYERAGDRALFAQARHELSSGIGLANTLVLLASSLAVVKAHAAWREGSRERATWGFRIALACGLAFVALKAVEYTLHVQAGHTPGSNDFFLYYFILTGLHLFHVFIGLGILALLQAQPQRHELTPQRRPFIEGGACFWHLVDLLWLVLFALLYLVS